MHHVADWRKPRTSLLEIKARSDAYQMYTETMDAGDDVPEEVQDELHYEALDSEHIAFGPDGGVHTFQDLGTRRAG